MSKTVSFRCSEELDEFLEEEAERRMTTKSAVAQMLLAERVRQLQGGGEGGEEPAPEKADQSDSGEVDQVGRGLPEIFDRYDEHWYRPDGQKYEFAVRLPGHDDTKYYKTQDGAADRLRKEYCG